MTREDLVTLRRALGLTQAEMAEAIGLKLRAYADLELGKSALKPTHALAAERAALSIAVQRGNPMLAPSGVRREALKLAGMITGA